MPIRSTEGKAFLVMPAGNGQKRKFPLVSSPPFPAKYEGLSLSLCGLECKGSGKSQVLTFHSFFGLLGDDDAEGEAIEWEFWEHLSRVRKDVLRACVDVDFRKLYIDRLREKGRQLVGHPPSIERLEHSMRLVANRLGGVTTYHRTLFILCASNTPEAIQRRLLTTYDFETLRRDLQMFRPKASG